MRKDGETIEEISEERRIKARAIVELFAYMENCVEDGTFYFKFSALHQLYEDRVRYLGIERETNRTRFKEKILAYFPQAQEQSDGKNKVLVFQQGMQQMLKQAMTCNYEGDALLLAKVAKIVIKKRPPSYFAVAAWTSNFILYFYNALDMSSPKLELIWLS